MTGEENILLKAVLDDPNNDDPRFGYAGWCERQSDEPIKARAGFIRAQISLVNDFNSLSYEQWFDLANRAEKLRNTYSSDWAGSLNTLVDEYTFDRGFIALVALSAGSFLNRAAELLALAPIRHLKLTEVLPVAEELFASTHLENIVSLDISQCRLGDRHLAMLAESPVLQNLKWLSVADNNIGFDGADDLAGSALSMQLVYVDFYGNPVDPGGRYSMDNEVVLDSWLPEAGERLEAEHGYLAWLHRDVDTIHELVPDRFRLT
ncbi:MAG: TIGR02996 domain-containing protein [Pyrinomonadaceae bacterium]|nr:TIGR02996 domain-containing protein [Pyrinomonadaceae bacterium]